MNSDSSPWMRRMLATLPALLLATGALAADVVPIGQAYRELPESPGTPDVRAEVVAAGEIFRAVPDAALLHLDNGTVLRFDANSAARLTALDEDTVEVTVLSGRVVLLDERERTLSAGSGSVFKVGPSLADPLEQEQRLLGVERADPATGRRVLPRRAERAARADR